MMPPTEDSAKVLRERLDQLANSVEGGNSIDGAQLFRRGVRRRRRRIAATTVFAAVGVVIAGVALGSVAQPEASSPTPTIGPAPIASDPPSPTPSSSGCELPPNFEQAVDLGMMTEAEACRYVEIGKQATKAREGAGDLMGPGELVVEGAPQEQALEDCRAGRRVFDEENDLLCDAMLKIASGELKPNETCGPPQCQEVTPIWRYSIAELRDLQR